jgi:hypothetical protein
VHRATEAILREEARLLSDKVRACSFRGSPAQLHSKTQLCRSAARGMRSKNCICSCTALLSSDSPAQSQQQSDGHRGGNSVCGSHSFPQVLSPVSKTGSPAACGQGSFLGRSWYHAALQGDEAAAADAVQLRQQAAEAQAQAQAVTTEAATLRRQLAEAQAQAQAATTQAATLQQQLDAERTAAAGMRRQLEAGDAERTATRKAAARQCAAAQTAQQRRRQMPEPRAPVWRLARQRCGWMNRVTNGYNQILEAIVSFCWASVAVSIGSTPAASASCSSAAAVSE